MQPIGIRRISPDGIRTVAKSPSLARSWAADPRGAVRVVLDRREAGRHTDLVALEVDPAVVLLLAAAAVANGEPALVVAAGAALLRLEQRLVRLVGRDLLEGRASHLPEAGRGRLVGSKRHRQTPSKNSIFWPAASVTIALRHGVV
jgi:CelD/BcsL family acetyltransferase involved in cellulose biosynthesis